MQKEIMRVIEDLEKRGYITVNEFLTKEALAMMFYQKLFQEMTVEQFLISFMPEA